MMDQRFTVQAVESMTKAELKAARAEYTRMRDIAQKRIKRLGESQFANAKAYQNYQLGFPKLKDIPKGHFAEAFSNLAKYVSAKSTTVSGQRSQMQKTIATWNQMGIPLNEKNYKQVFDMLHRLRQLKKVFDSERVVMSVDKVMSRPDISWKKLLRSPLLAKVAENPAKLAALPEKEKGTYTIKEMRKVFGW